MLDASERSNPPMKVNSKSPSKRPASLQPLPLAVYLTGAVGGTFLVSAPQAEAAVTSVTFGFGSVLENSDDASIFPTTPNLGGLFAAGIPIRGVTVIAVGNLPSYYGRSYHNGEGNSYFGTARFFASGTVIGNGLNGPLGGGYFSSQQAQVNIPSDQLNKNIGFHTSTNNFGWANVSWDATAKALTFHSAYVESVPGNTIIVGDVGAVPEPSRALLALAGFGAVALRRRRKQAA